MMSGTVMPQRQPVVPVTIIGAAGQQVTVDALLDTGYNGTLMLLPGVIASLGLPMRLTTRASLADGRIVRVPTFAGRILWNGTQRQARILAGGSQPLLGMALCVGHNVSVDMVDGGRVQIAALA